MKISEVIKKLEELKARHGDLPVYYVDPMMGPDPVVFVGFKKSCLVYGKIVIPDRVDLTCSA